MDSVLFPMLSNICILMDTLRGRFKDLESVLFHHCPSSSALKYVSKKSFSFEPSRIIDNTNYRREYLMIMLKATQSIICEEDWVTLKMFRIVETNKMEAFNHDRLKQNCLVSRGKPLLFLLCFCANLSLSYF